MPPALPGTGARAVAAPQDWTSLEHWRRPLIGLLRVQSVLRAVQPVGNIEVVVPRRRSGGSSGRHLGRRGRGSSRRRVPAPVLRLRRLRQIDQFIERAPDRVERLAALALLAVAELDLPVGLCDGDAERGLERVDQRNRLLLQPCRLKLLDLAPEPDILNLQPAICGS